MGRRSVSGRLRARTCGDRYLVLVPTETISPTRIRAVVLLVALTLLALLVPQSSIMAASRYNLEATYGVSLYLDWDSRWTHVKTTIDLRNTSGGPVDRLQLNTSAAKLGGLKGLKVKVDGVIVPASKTGQTIVVPLGKVLEVDETATVYVAYRARLTTRAGGRAYYFAKLGGVAQLYRFIPWLSRKIPFGNQDHGEPFLTPVSPRVEVEVSSNRRLVWATSGRRTGKTDPRTYTFVATNVRDFNIAASPGFKTVRGTSKDGQTKILAHTRSGNGARLVRLAKEELARYEAKTGVPYPHSTYRVVETGGGLAMESPGAHLDPRSRSAADHPYLVSHETAHQWWYSAVGNDQSTNAFADEALADYYARKAHLSIRPSRCKTDRLDRAIRAYSTVLLLRGHLCPGRTLP